MFKHALILNPGHNRVYFQAAKDMAFAELAAFCKKQGIGVSDVSERSLGGLPCLCFTLGRPLGGAQVTLLSRLSFVYGVFLFEGELLRPIDCGPEFVFDEDLNTILKYTGKTNERFTRLMLNLALFASDFDQGERLNLLDPMCGRGTTLFEGMTQGLNVWGADVEKTAIHEADVFLTKYFERAKIIHKKAASRVGAPGGKKLAERTDFLYAHSRKEFDCDPRRASLLRCDALELSGVLKKDSFHLLVTDLPYGVQHGGYKLGEMMDRAFRVWRALLRKGAGVSVAFNAQMIKRAEIEAQAVPAGFTLAFAPVPHRVDQAIVRDVVTLKAQ